MYMGGEDIKQYRKKSIVVEAIQFTRQNRVEVERFTNNRLHSIKIPRCIDGVMTATVDTLEAKYKATENDYIIKGISGEFYPCKPDIFHKTYEEV